MALAVTVLPLFGAACGHRRAGLAARARMAISSAVGRAPRGQGNPAWLGTAIDLDDLGEVAAESGLELETVVGRGTQFCMVGARRVGNRAG